MLLGAPNFQKRLYVDFTSIFVKNVDLSAFCERFPLILKYSLSLSLSFSSLSSVRCWSVLDLVRVAATYVRQVRQNKVTSNFGWKDYLEKLNKGQRGATETILAETNLSYQKSMATATTMAVEKGREVIHHTFNFLSLCAPKPLSLDIVVNYILNVDEEIDDWHESPKMFAAVTRRRRD